MNRYTGEPTHIEDYLITVRTGPWFGWTDSKNKIYANLIVHDGGTKPTEEEVNAGYQALKDKWVAEEYIRNRQIVYPSLQEQIDMQYWDSVNGTTTWNDAISKIKSDNPKPS